MELVLHLSDSPEHKQTKCAKYNLRKSLAWDSAFFTSEGVLDPEELAVVNSTFRKVEASVLPAIPEDTRKSTESTSTLDNDSWALENMEVELFENVRASIQRSLGNVDKTSKIACPSTKIVPLQRDVLFLESAEKVESSSHIKKKPNLASERTSKNQRSSPKLGTEGNTSSKVLLKPPRILATASLPKMPGDAGSQKAVRVTKIPNGVPSSSNARSLLLRKTSSTSSGSSQNSVINLSDSVSNSKLLSTKKLSTSMNIRRSSSGPTTSKIPVKTTRTSGIDRKASSPNMLPSSTVKLYSAISPTSSFDSMASETSSTASKASKVAWDFADAGSSSSSTSLEGSEKDLVNLTSIQYNARNRYLPVGSHVPAHPSSKGSEEESLALEKPKGDHTRVYSSINQGGKSFKPSGLRMPTPKVGYFDAEKTKFGNIEKFARSSQQHNMLKATNVANVPKDYLKATAGVSKSMTMSKPKNDKLQLRTPSSSNMVASDPPTVETDLVSASRIESSLVQEFSEAAKSHSPSNLTEGHSGLISSSVKVSSSKMERSSERKPSNCTEALRDKGADDELPNIRGNEDVCIISTPRKVEAGVVMRGTQDSVIKCSDKESDSLVVTTGKENVSPAENL